MSLELPFHLLQRPQSLRKISKDFGQVLGGGYLCPLLPITRRPSADHICYIPQDCLCKLAIYEPEYTRMAVVFKLTICSEELIKADFRDHQ